MAIDTNNEKLALISYNQPFNPAIPISSDGLDWDDKQHLIWQYPGLEWETPGAVTDNNKLALITYHQPWNTPIPAPVGVMTQGDKQHLLWEYPGILWGEGVAVEISPFNKIVIWYLLEEAKTWL